jgi:hypothetical protein
MDAAETGAAAATPQPAGAAPSGGGSAVAAPPQQRAAEAGAYTLEAGSMEDGSPAGSDTAAPLHLGPSDGGSAEQMAPDAGMQGAAPAVSKTATAKPSASAALPDAGAELMSLRRHVAELQAALERSTAQVAAERSRADAAEAAAETARLDAEDAMATAAAEVACEKLRTHVAQECARMTEQELAAFKRVKREVLDIAEDEIRAAAVEAEQATAAAAATAQQAAAAAAEAARLRSAIDSSESRAAAAMTRRHGNLAVRKELLMQNLLCHVYGRLRPDHFGGVVFVYFRDAEPGVPLFVTNGSPNGARPVRGFGARLLRLWRRLR